MKKNDLNDLKKKTTVQLIQKLNELNKEKLEVTIEAKIGKVKNVHLGQGLKRDIAKVMTILKLKQITENSKPTNIKEDNVEEINAAN